MRHLILLILFCSGTMFAQNPYPQDYFKSPLEIPIVLSGTFAELRSNHFHSGLDIKTQQREGLKVLATAEGYVSRIKISHGGYGKALYLTHPNGYVSVYAHLKRFSEEIEAYVKTKQYEQETFEIELFPTPDELKVSHQEVVAYSGNTGGSGGPHLHFEIRDKQERPINPMLFGIKTRDSRKPLVLRAFAYPIDKDSHVNNSAERTELRLIPTPEGDYRAEQIEAFGTLGIGVVSYDRQDMAANKNGVWNIQTFYNGNKNLEIDFRRFSFSETKHLNRLIDYEFWRTQKSRIQKLFIEPNNPLSLYTYHDNKGYVKVLDSTSSIYKIRIRDFEGNESWLTIPIEGKQSNSLKPKTIEATDHFIYADQPNQLKDKNISVSFPKNTFYDDFFINFEVNSDTLKLHEPTIPAQKNFYINFDISHYDEEDKSRLYIAGVSNYGKTYPMNSQRKGDILSCRTKSLGTYTLAMDQVGPSVRPVNFQEGKWLSKYRYLKLKIEDDDSGIRNYRATINGKWILMEYDYKKGTLVYDFNDNVINDTKNNLKLIVTDNVGNSSTFETIFFRK